jgi:hypothetical protein
MEWRNVVRDFLAADSALMATLTGGLYPETAGAARGQTEVSRDAMPAAFDQSGDVKPCGLVVEDGTVPDGLGALTTFRVLLYQQYGRDRIAAAAERIFDLLDGRRFDVAQGFIYEIRFAGHGPSTTRDGALRDASLGWTRWQAARTLR